jgi:hypothetical protein
VASYLLEHFYYGQFVRDGQAFGEPRLLAYSGGIKPELAEELTTQNPLPALEGVPDGAWAIVRSKAVPFVFIQAQTGAAGQVMRHFIIVQSDVLRALGGNLDALSALIEPQMPVYDRLGDRLRPLSLPQAGPPSDAEQIDHLLELMTITHNNSDVIKALLAGVVQGVQIIVRAAPPALEPRVNLVKGLLALLPPPARFGVTFATHSRADTPLDAQIRFIGEETPPPDTLVFDWPDARLSGRIVEDDYSQFMISQLRLDATFVLQETSTLTPIAAWRIKQGDSLAAALAYASYRKTLDHALANNLPVEISEVSDVLAHDRTLDADLRRRYAHHVLAFSLALGNMQFADPIAPLLRQDEALENDVLQKLDETLAAGQIELVYDTLTRWLGNPMGPQGHNWLQLAHQAILARMDQLGNNGDVAGINAFLIDIQRANPGLEVSRVVPRLIELALPLSLRHQPLAQTIFLLAMNYLDLDVVLRLLDAPRYVAQMPAPIRRLVPVLHNRQPDPAPPGLLMEVSSAFGPEWQPLLLLRCTEAALNAARPDLLDAAALNGLVSVASDRWGLQHRELLESVVQYLSTDEWLPALDDALPLLQILLLLGDYAALAREMLHQARVLYPGDRQIDYTQQVQRLFARTPLTPARAMEALRAIEANGIRSTPLIMAQIGVLEQHENQPGVEALAQQVIHSLEVNPVALSVMPARPMHDLLRFFLKREDIAGAVKVGGFFPEVAAHHGTAGVTLMIQMYKALYAGKTEFQLAGMELLRRYIRQSDATAARQAITQFGRELGLAVREALEATYRVKRLMSGVDFYDYAHFLHLTTELLDNTVRAYSDRSSLPSLGALVNTVQSLSGGLMDDESQAIADSILHLAQTLVALGADYRAHLSRDQDKHIDGLLRGETDPRSTLDVLWIMGGYFAKGRRYRMRFVFAQHPLGERSAPALKEEVEISDQLLRGILQAFPPEKDLRVTAAALRGEIESLWGGLDEAQRHSLVRDLAIDFQRLVQLIDAITASGDARAVEVNSALGRRLDDGKTQPKSTLEFYRYLYGYFKVP